MGNLLKNDSVFIRDVWSDNLEEEFALIREIVDGYPYISMDTEFPGIVLRPVGNFKTKSSYNYQTLKDNVDMLSLIQLGLTFSDEEGNLPTCGTDKFCVWQFNFSKFNLCEDLFENNSIELLRRSGIDFELNKKKGVDAESFGELLMSSGIVLNADVRFVTFHSGYDFGYLLKILKGILRSITTVFIKRLSILGTLVDLLSPCKKIAINFICKKVRNLIAQWLKHQCFYMGMLLKSIFQVLGCEFKSPHGCT